MKEHVTYPSPSQGPPWSCGLKRSSRDELHFLSSPRFVLLHEHIWEDRRFFWVLRLSPPSQYMIKSLLGRKKSLLHFSTLHHRFYCQEVFEFTCWISVVFSGYSGFPHHPSDLIKSWLERKKSILDSIMIHN